MSGGYPGARAAGMLGGIIAAWRHSAIPGALDDLIELPTEYGTASASVTLVFGGLPGHEDSAGVFRVTCECLTPEPIRMDEDTLEIEAGEEA